MESDRGFLQGQDAMQTDGIEPGFFRAMPLETPGRLRPLGALSDVVVDLLPSLLGEVRAGRTPASTLTALVAAADTATLWREQTAALRPLACLDLTLLQHACDHVGAVLPAAVADETAALCRSLGRIDAFLYEDCVLSNPLDRDPRVFAEGRAGLAERDFLWVHQRIEADLLTIIERLLDLLRASQAPAGWRAATLGDALARHEPPIRRSLLQVDALFAAMRDLSPTDFRAFRDYYMPSPRSGHPGPSGRFSARFFMLRLLVEGDAAGRHQPDLLREIVRMFDYFPSADRDALIARIDPGSSALHALGDADAARVRRLSTPGPHACLRLQALQPWAQRTALPALLRLARDVLDRCTALHLGLVRKYVTARDDPPRQVA